MTSDKSYELVEAESDAISELKKKLCIPGISTPLETENNKTNLE